MSAPVASAGARPRGGRARASGIAASAAPSVDQVAAMPLTRPPTRTPRRRAARPTRSVDPMPSPASTWPEMSTPRRACARCGCRASGRRSASSSVAHLRRLAPPRTERVTTSTRSSRLRRRVAERADALDRDVDGLAVDEAAEARGGARQMMSPGRRVHTSEMNSMSSGILCSRSAVLPLRRSSPST